jgi:hypothetical protein
MTRIAITLTTQTANIENQGCDETGLDGVSKKVPVMPAAFQANGAAAGQLGTIPIKRIEFSARKSCFKKRFGISDENGRLIGLREI